MEINSSLKKGYFYKYRILTWMKTFKQFYGNKIDIIEIKSNPKKGKFSNHKKYNMNENP